MILDPREEARDKPFFRGQPMVLACGFIRALVSQDLIQGLGLIIYHRLKEDQHEVHLRLSAISHRVSLRFKALSFKLSETWYRC